MGKAIKKRGRVGLRRARAIAVGDAATVFSGFAAAAMFSGALYCSSATGGTNSNKPGYDYHDSARAISAVSPIRIFSQKSEPDPDGIAMARKYRSDQVDLSGDSMTGFPGTRMEFKNNTAVEGKPQENRSLFRLIKDGWRAVTGLVRGGNPVDYSIAPAAATIGVRGSVGEAWECIQGPQCTRQTMLNRHDATPR
jgi:hypothetical protein